MSDINKMKQVLIGGDVRPKFPEKLFIQCYVDGCNGNSDNLCNHLIALSLEE